MAFSKSLINFFKDNEPNAVLSIFTEDLYNNLILFLIKMITSLEKNASEEYTKALAELVRILSYNKITLSKNVIDYVITFGNSGKNNSDKRYCIFFCSQLLQIEKDSNKDLIGKYFALHNDNEKVVRREVAFQLRNIIKAKSQDYYNCNLVDVVKKLVQESEISIQIEAIISILENYDKAYEDDDFNRYLINILMNLIKNTKMDNKENIKRITKLVQALLKISSENIKVAQIFEKDVMLIFEVIYN